MTGRPNNWKPYTAEEINLLRELCQAKPPMLWTDIAARFPNRTLQGLRDKARAEKMGRATGVRGRPRLMVVKDFDDSDRETRVEKRRIASATKRLGEAIESLFERQGWRIAA